MKGRILLSMSAFLAVAASSCIYHYDVDIPKSEEVKIVVEGDILVGSDAEFVLSYTEALSGEPGNFMFPPARFRVEAENGSSYQAVKSPVASVYVADLKDAPRDTRYRVHFTLEGDTVPEYWGREYVSEWREPQPAPVVDSVSCAPNLKDTTDLEIYLTMNSDSPSGCYRWDYEESWKFHAKYKSDFYVDLISWQILPATDYLHYNYWCYGQNSSKSAGLIIAKSLEGARLVNHRVLSHSRFSYEFQEKYCIDITARSISEEDYNYLNVLQQSSTDLGSLFSAMPGSKAGNIRCVDKPDQRVLGFVEVCSISKKRFFVDGKKWKLGNYSEYDLVEQRGNTTFHMVNVLRYLPVRYDETYHVYFWAPARCVDCTSAGGTLTKPDWDQ